ncbi:MAG: M23 family metallopeptidase [Thermoflavifilum sp.]|nr:M23 family metallopeptidase [Thermoflavifilum sp.]
MHILKISALLGGLLIFSLSAAAQSAGAPFSHPHAFTSPLHIPLLLAGNYGELRPNHFHAGLDIKTQGRTGLPVYAAADGYISRVAISNSGYGHVIYIQHPDGYTTVYGHLDRFMPALAAYVKQQQYAQQSWAIDLTLNPQQFPVHRGQLIAWSGNTGAAVGPHLHFEIRNTPTQTPLNPQLFGLPVEDHIPPTVYRIAIYDRDKSMYLQRPLQLPVHLVQGQWTTKPSEILVNATHIGIGMQVLDHENGTSNSFGIYEARLDDNGQPVAAFRLDSIPFSLTEDVNAHMDYQTWREDGRPYQLFFPLPGNRLPIYQLYSPHGIIDLSDGKLHHLSLTVKDASGNTRVVRFSVRQRPGLNAQPSPSPNCISPMRPGQHNIVDEPALSFDLPPDALYDAICFRFSIDSSRYPQLLAPVYHLSPATIPMKTDFTLYLKPWPDIPEPLLNKLVIIRKAPGEQEITMAEQTSNGWIAGRFRGFGDFEVKADTVAPLIKPLAKLYPGIKLSHAREIRFRVSDNLSGVASYEAELDGKWLLMGQFRNTIYYTFDEHCPPGRHTLVIRVSDRAKNTRTYELHFIR